MAKELKIVIGSNTYETLVYLNDEPIGMIQDIKIHVNCNEIHPTIEIVFPNLFGMEISDTYYRASSIPKQLAQHMWDLSDIPNVKVTLKDLF